MRDGLWLEPKPVHAPSLPGARGRCGVVGRSLGRVSNPLHPESRISIVVQITTAFMGPGRPPDHPVLYPTSRKTDRMPEPSALDLQHPPPRITNLIAATLLAIMAILLVTSVRLQSQTFDESTHLFAGFEYWKHGDFGRNPEHPPFVKLLASFPLLPMGLHEPPAFPFPYFKAQDLFNASQLLYTADADAILLRGRLMIALLSLSFGLLVFLATKEIFGPLAAVLALFLFAFEPNLLANGAIVTTDMGLALFLFASVYTFYRFCNKPSAARLALCAVATSLGIVAKHSGVLILPTLVLLALADLLLPYSGKTTNS